MRRSLLAVGFALVLTLSVCSYSYANNTCCAVPVAKIQQEQTWWCWATCCQTILAFYSITKSQGEIAEWACNTADPDWCTDCSCCRVTPVCACCNHGNSLSGADHNVDQILQHFGIASTIYLTRAMTTAEILIDVCPDNCKPFIIRWYYPSEGYGHEMVGRGYCTSNDFVYYMDPADGDYHTALYAWMVADAGGIHIWNQSLRLCVAGPTAVELASLDAIAHEDYIDVRWVTATEIDNSGFNLYRSLTAEGERFDISQGLIAAQGDEVKGAAYSFADHDVTEGVTYYYWLEDVDLQGKTTMHGPVFAASASVIGTPSEFSLAQSQPNPFRVTTEISYGLPDACRVNLSIFDVMGKKVTTLVEGHQPSGYKVVRWDGKDENGLEVSGGIYFYRLEAGSHSDINKMILLR